MTDSVTGSHDPAGPKLPDASRLPQVPYHLVLTDRPWGVTEPLAMSTAVLRTWANLAKGWGRAAVDRLTILYHRTPRRVFGALG